MSTESERAASAPERHGQVDFTITYDDTGAETVVTAPNGWKIRQVFEQGYKQLGETPRPGDRVEANGVAMDPYFDLHVKEFVAQRIAPALHFNIVSNTGGAARPDSAVQADA